MSTTASIATVLVVLFAVANGYSKYGRTCKDIGCLSHEVCVMQEDPCDKYQREACGPYPTCKKINNGGETCKTKSCDKGTYCKTENGRPVCVPTTPGLAPAARRPPGYVRPTPPTPRPTPPTPPPRGSSFGGDGRYSGTSGHRNSIGGNSIWDRLFGGGSGSRSGGSSRPTPAPPSYPRYPMPPPSRPVNPPPRPVGPPTNYYPGGKNHYNTHTSTDSKGNRVWTFSG